MSKLQKIILKENIHQLGKEYEIRLVKGGFFRYLWKEGKVFPFNKKSLCWLEKQKEKKRQYDLLKEEKAKEIYQKINNLQLSFDLKKNPKGKVFGSVGEKEILEKIKNLGFDFGKKKLLDFVPLNKVGENLVKIKVGENRIAEIKINIIEVE